MRNDLVILVGGVLLLGASSSVKVGERDLSLPDFSTPSDFSIPKKFDPTRRVGSSPVTFTDRTIFAGLDAVGFGGGAAWRDFDGDCNLDLYVTNFGGGLANRLYQNNGDGTFTDVTASSGVGDTRDTQGTAFGDFDNDGNPDIYVANWNSQTDALYQNNGNSTFTDISASAGVLDAASGHGMAWGDYNNDGLLDMYVTNQGDPNFLYHNNGNGTFTDVAPAAGVNDPGSSSSATFGDFDNDGDLDLYVTKFSGSNILYQNNGNGTFTDVTVLKGVGDLGLSSAASFGDYDNDGDLDLYVGNRGSANTLYRNNGGPSFTFTDVTAFAGVGDAQGCGGVTFGDVDQDGYLDIYVSNGVNVGSVNILYRNNGDGTFTDVTASAGVGDLGAGHGHIFGDYDNDGDLDIFIINASGSNVLYQNNGTPNNWLVISTVGTVSNRDGIGARVTVVAGTLSMIQEVSGGDGHDTQNSLPLEFGLAGNLQADLVEVRWPSGIVDVCENVPTNNFITVTEGEGCLKTPAPRCPCESVEPPQMRTQGYWKRQCKNNPHEDICALTTEVLFLSDHFDDFDCDAICDLLRVEPPENDMCRKAERQFMALLLNVASGKLSPCNCLSDGRTVGEVIAEIEELLAGDPGHATCERAKTLADDINRGASLVDCNSQNDNNSQLTSFPSNTTQPSHILEAFPNPFTSTTLIHYITPVEREQETGDRSVSLKVYNLSGRLVRTLVDGSASSGPIPNPESRITVAWDGRDEAGERVPSGVYLYRLTSGTFGTTMKLILLH